MTKSKRNKFSFSNLFYLLFKYKVGLLQAFLLQLIWIVIEVVFPFITQAIVDIGINQNDRKFIYVLLVGQLILFLAVFISEFLRFWVLRQIGIRINLILVKEYYSDIIFKNIRSFKEIKQGDLFQHVNDNFRIENFITVSSVNFISAVFQLIVFGVVLIIFNTHVFFVFFSSVLLSLFWDVLFLKYREKIDHKKFRIGSNIRGQLMDTQDGIIDIKANNLEYYQLKRWEYVQDKLSVFRLLSIKISQTYLLGNSALDVLRNIFVLLFSALSVLEGEMTIGGMLAIQYILGRSTKPLTDIMKYVQDRQDARLSLSRLDNITNTTELEFDPGDRINTERKIIGDIKLEDVCFRYNTQIVIENINIKIEYGSTAIIVGASGSGKSTLIKILMRLIEAETGKTFIGNNLIENIHHQVLRQNCAYVSQDSFLFSGSIKYNITLMEEDVLTDENLLMTALNICCLDDIIGNLEGGVETLIGRGNTQLSKGQIQRIFLARTVYKNANYLILDEPTSALDNITSKTIISNLQQFYKGKTIIIATHKLKLYEDAENIMYIKNGRIVEQGAHEYLMELKGHYFHQNIESI